MSLGGCALNPLSKQPATGSPQHERSNRNVRWQTKQKRLKIQTGLWTHPRSGRGGRRFECCHSGQDLLERVAFTGVGRLKLGAIIRTVGIIAVHREREKC